jgi:hypothetical protein
MSEQQPKFEIRDEEQLSRSCLTASPFPASSIPLINISVLLALGLPRLSFV